MAVAARNLPCVRKLIAFRHEHVMDMLHSLVDDSPARNPSAVDRPPLEPKRDRSVMGGGQQLVAFLKQHDSVMGAADLAGALDN